jgi:hypothetical protein
VEGEGTDAEYGRGDERAECRPVGVQLTCDCDSYGAGDRGDGIELGVGSDERRCLACDDITQDAVADGSRDSERRGGDRTQAVVSALSVPATQKSPRPAASHVRAWGAGA